MIFNNSFVENFFKNTDKDLPVKRHIVTQVLINLIQEEFPEIPEEHRAHYISAILNTCATELGLQSRPQDSGIIEDEKYFQLLENFQKSIEQLHFTPQELIHKMIDDLDLATRASELNANQFLKKSDSITDEAYNETKRIHKSKQLEVFRLLTKKLSEYNGDANFNWKNFYTEDDLGNLIFLDEATIKAQFSFTFQEYLISCHLLNPLLTIDSRVPGYTYQINPDSWELSFVTSVDGEVITRTPLTQFETLQESFYEPHIVFAARKCLSTYPFNQNQFIGDTDLMMLSRFPSEWLATILDEFLPDQLEIIKKLIWPVYDEQTTENDDLVNNLPQAIADTNLFDFMKMQVLLDKLISPYLRGKKWADVAPIIDSITDPQMQAALIKICYRRLRCNYKLESFKDFLENLSESLSDDGLQAILAISPNGILSDMRWAEGTTAEEIGIFFNSFSDKGFQVIELKNDIIQIITKDDETLSEFLLALSQEQCEEFLIHHATVIQSILDVKASTWADIIHSLESDRWEVVYNQLDTKFINQIIKTPDDLECFDDIVSWDEFKRLENQLRSQPETATNLFGLFATDKNHMTPRSPAPDTSKEDMADDNKRKHDGDDDRRDTNSAKTQRNL